MHIHVKSSTNSISSCCVNKNANVAHFLTSVIIKYEEKSAKGSKERIKHKKKSHNMWSVNPSPVRETPGVSNRK